MNDVQKGSCVIAIILAIVAALLFVVLIADSFRVLSPNEMGLLYNVASKHLDRETLYSSGRHYVGVGNYFIIYPKTVQSLTINSISARTQDGLGITLELSFNYRVIADIDSIVKIYDTFGENYTVVLTKMSSNIVRDVAASIEAFSYFVNRSTVSLKMDAALSEQINFYGFSIDSFQLLNMVFPETFSDAIVETQVAQQQIEQISYVQLAALVEANTSIAEANRTAAMVRLQAEASAVAIITASQSQATALEVALEQERTAYSILIDDLDLTPDQFVTWVWLTAMADTTSSKSIVVTKPDILKSL